MGWLLLLGLERRCSNLQMCQGLGWLLAPSGLIVRVQPWFGAQNLLVEAAP